MQQVPEPIVKDLVLIGGGHSHAIALRLFGLHPPIPGIRLTLISEAADTPYSGMLPGHVAGFYNRDECYIDLQRLARFARSQFYVDRVVGLDLQNNRTLCAERPPIRFDLVSIDIGSTPSVPQIPNEAEADAYSIPAKPIRQFLERWQQAIAQIVRNPPMPVCIAIVGGGVGGIELSLAIQHRLQQIFAAAGQPASNLEMHLFHRDAELLRGHNCWVRQRLLDVLTDRGITVHLAENVLQVDRHMLKCESGLTVACDYVFWVTQASAPAWLGKAGLAVDAQGFVRVRDTLQSISHPQVFAAGDIAAAVKYPRPKAGVFAVRQGKPLYRNLCCALAGESLSPYIPQRQFLNLIGTSDGSAIASRELFCGESPLLWYWKDRIDRQFMQQFQELPDLAPVVIRL